MYLAINGVEIAAYPYELKASVMDLDDAESTKRTADGTLTRDRIAVKRQIDLVFGALTTSQLSAILQAMSGVFFNFTYLDPLSGQQTTKNFYVGNRTSAVAITRNGVTWWQGLELTLTER